MHHARVATSVWCGWADWLVVVVAEGKCGIAEQQRQADRKVSCPSPPQPNVCGGLVPSCFTAQVRESCEGYVGGTSIPIRSKDVFQGAAASSVFNSFQKASKPCATSGSSSSSSSWGTKGVRGGGSNGGERGPPLIRALHNPPHVRCNAVHSLGSGSLATATTTTPTTTASTTTRTHAHTKSPTATATTADTVPATHHHHHQKQQQQQRPASLLLSRLSPTHHRDRPSCAAGAPDPSPPAQSSRCRTSRRSAASGGFVVVWRRAKVLTRVGRAVHDAHDVTDDSDWLFRLSSTIAVVASVTVVSWLLLPATAAVRPGPCAGHHHHHYHHHGHLHTPCFSDPSLSSPYAHACSATAAHVGLAPPSPPPPPPCLPRSPRSWRGCC